MKLVFHDGTSVEVPDASVPAIPVGYFSEVTILVRSDEDTVELSLNVSELSQLVSFLQHYT